MKHFRFNYLLGAGVRNLWTQRLMSVATIVVLVIGMVLVSSSSVVFLNIDKTLSHMEAQNVIMVFIEDELPEEEQVKLGEQFSAMENVSKCEFVSGEAAWEDQVASLGDDASVILEGIEESPLPNSYRIVLDDMSLFQNTVEEIKGINGVLSVRENSEVASKLTQVRRIFSIVSVCVFVLFSIISLSVTVTTLSLAINNRRLEISIQKSVGATNAFIVTPFIIQGALYGVISAILSLLIMYGAYNAVLNMFTSISVSLNGTLLPFKTFAVPMFVLFLTGGVSVGIIGSLIPMHKYLKKGSGIYGED